MAREINLVPDVKEEMIKALKLRNFILFLFGTSCFNKILFCHNFFPPYMTNIFLRLFVNYH